MARNRYNTPGVIKYPFWQMPARPKEIASQAICVDGDIAQVVHRLGNESGGEA